MPNLASILSDTAARLPGHTALRIGDSVMSYGALDALSSSAAALIAAHGIGPGDRVGLLLPDIPPLAELYYGILRHGGIAVPLNPLLTAPEIAGLLGDSGARLLFAFGYDDILAAAEEAGAETGAEVIPVNTGSFRELLAAAEPRPDIAETADDDAAVILYTAGVTGTPKGATLSHANLRSNAEAAGSLLPMRESDVVFGGLPLFHGFGQTLVLNAAVLAGAAISLLPRFVPETALQIIDRDRVTIFAGVPEMYEALLGSPAVGQADTSTVRWGISGGAPLPDRTRLDFEQVFGAPVLEAYGLSETSPVVSVNLPNPERRPGSVGRPVPGMEVRIVDSDTNDAPQGEVGELLTRGEGLMLGYWNDPDATAAAQSNGWFHSGDLARVDDLGNIYIMGRTTD